MNPAWEVIFRARFHGQVVELAKTPRPILDKGKGKGKQNSKDKAKEKETEPPLAYDYHDGSVHDSALRAHILRGYERFKVRLSISI